MQSVESKVAQFRLVGVAIQAAFDDDGQKFVLQAVQVAYVASVQVAQLLEHDNVHFPELDPSIAYPFPAQPPVPAAHVSSAERAKAEAAVLQLPIFLHVPPPTAYPVLQAVLVAAALHAVAFGSVQVSQPLAAPFTTFPAGHSVHAPVSVLHLVQPVGQAVSHIVAVPEVSELYHPTAHV